MQSLGDRCRLTQKTAGVLFGKNFAFDANERRHEDARMEVTLQSGYILNKLPEATNRNDTPTSRDDFDSLCQVLFQHH